MRSVLPAATEAVGGYHHSSLASSVTASTTVDSFCKDDRRISVGDCALFKPSQDSPPFIGLIRCLTLTEEKNLHLGVNWLYRPSEVKLGKGSLLDAAPNEIFYSFHKDETPAASLLHPCKVAFLPRGVELPTGTSSFVCRRVYDIANKCLWWLTDQDYINERQEEIDQLLYKTRTEMHGTLQPGDRSPKQVNSPSSTALLKPGCDSGQNSGTSIPSQVKGKKRERGDHGTEPIKRERSFRLDDCESIQCKPGTNLKPDIARITEKGGVTNLDGVEKLIQLMQSSRTDRNRDLLGRSMLAGVVAATDKVDCLEGFVQLRGLPVLDEWLQDIHKGKIGDGYSLKDGDKSVEEFLLVLLRALDKLPVNLHALQMCNIGKSVNHLRSHKNLEVQRKARSLVDTWKKRVEAEMNSIDTKSGSAHTISVWPSKSRVPEASQNGSRTPSGSDVAMKSSVTQSTVSKTTSVRSSHGESNVKSATSSPEPLKSSLSPASASGKESQSRILVGGTPDVPVIREDRSSSSNQSNNCTQSFSGKEDGKSSSAGLTTVSKISGGAARNRKNTGLSIAPVSGSQKESIFSRVSSAHKSIVTEKSQQSVSTCERVLEGPVTDGSIQKLIVKIPNRVRSPSHGVNGESLEDPTFSGSRASSTMLLDKHDQFDRSSKDKTDAFRSNVASDMNQESWQHSDSKGLFTGSGEVAGSPAALPGEEQSMPTKDSATNHLKSLKLHESSFSPMKALIESCVKYSAGNPSLSLDDEVGMNLLASVATREMSRSDLVSPTDSTEMSTPAVEENGVVDEAKSKSSLEMYESAIQSQFCTDAECDDKNQTVLDSNPLPDESLHLLKKLSVKFPGDIQFPPSRSSEDIPAGEGDNHLDSSSTDVRKSADTEWETCGKSSGTTVSTSLRSPLSMDKLKDDQSNGEIHEEKVNICDAGTNGVLNCKSEENIAMAMEKASIGIEEGKLTVDITESKHSCEGDCKKDLDDGLDIATDAQEKVSTNIKYESSERDNSIKLPQSAYGQKSVLEVDDEVKSGKPDINDAKSCMNELKIPNFVTDVSRNVDTENHTTSGFCSTSDDQKSGKDSNVDKSKISEHMSLPENGCSSSVNHEAQQKAEFKESKSSSMQVDAVEKSTFNVKASTSATREADPNIKMKFDLNEGFSADDGKYGEPTNSVSSLSTSVHMMNSIPLSVSSVPSGHPASITVAAAAKGPFVPPEDLMKIKGELGWKGSAATSAFRPAEPRKSLETQICSTNGPYNDSTTNKHGRVLLDFDLNVPDERVLEELASRDCASASNLTTDYVSKNGNLLNDGLGSVLFHGSGGLDLDLNRVDEANDNPHYSISGYHKGENSIAHIKPFVGLPTGDFQRDFDLNDGPVVDNTSVDQISISKKVKGSLPSQLPSAGLRINSPGLGNFSSWFPPGNTYSTVAIPSALPDRVDQPFPVFPPGASQRSFGPIGVAPFTPELYRGSILSSAPAVPFPSSHFQFPVFPLGATFPLPSATFSVGANSYADSSSGARFFAPPVNPQFLAPVGSLTSQFQRPYVVNLPDSGSYSVLENDRKWGRPGLDLNAGPGIVESEVKEESSAQHSVAVSQAVAEEHTRMLSVSSGISKRKEPEGGWDNESVRYKQFSWQ
ncbi:hypothetical protein F511_22718 [Dorcoceras hygrometricum]|uniref:BAH domain-containing protein n=1 Tax=Dorcoceras hygrometricum TaxID=472368 RepID=A0A2Z7BYH8_9LAMI|nr:hypothetical protein F511_22718 [Dorcoceras hygrometricum]